MERQLLLGTALIVVGGAPLLSDGSLSIFVTRPISLGTSDGWYYIRAANQNTD